MRLATVLIGLLVFLLPGAAPPPPRAAEVRRDSVEMTELEDWQGQAAWRFETPTATWVWHRAGAAFASLLDPDGHDWISYRPGGGSAGEFRGIPNVINPEGGFHPGKTSGESRLVRQDADRVELAAEAIDGAWACRWTILPDRAELTLNRAGHPYWLLYEGTPGGAYDEMQAYLVDSAGHREPCTSRWERRLPDPRWIYFGTAASNYVLYLIDATPRAPDVVDSFWSMQQNMTVFGFGRILDSRSDRWSHLTETPARLVVGLLPAGEHAVIAGHLNALAARR